MRRLLKGVLTNADSWVAGAQQDEIAVQNSGRINVTIGDDEGGPGKRVDGEQCESCGGGSELDVGGWRKEPCVVEAVDQLAFERGDAYAELSVAERGLREDGIDAVSERAFNWRLHCARSRKRAGAVRLRAGTGREYEKSAEKDRHASARNHHGRSLTGQ